MGLLQLIGRQEGRSSLPGRMEAWETRKADKRSAAFDDKVDRQKLKGLISTERRAEGRYQAGIKEEAKKTAMDEKPIYVDNLYGNATPSTKKLMMGIHEKQGIIKKTPSVSAYMENKDLKWGQNLIQSNQKSSMAFRMGTIKTSLFDVTNKLNTLKQQEYLLENPEQAANLEPEQQKALKKIDLKTLKGKIKQLNQMKDMFDNQSILLDKDLRKQMLINKGKKVTAKEGMSAEDARSEKSINEKYTNLAKAWKAKYDAGTIDPDTYAKGREDIEKDRQTALGALRRTGSGTTKSGGKYTFKNPL